MELMLNIALRATRKAGELIVQSMDRIDLLNIEEKAAMTSSPRWIVPRKRRLSFFG